MLKTKTMLKKYSFVWLLLASLLLTGTAVAREDPEAFTMRTTNEVLDLLRKNDALIQSDPEAIFKIVSNKVIPLFNFTRMTQLAMGKHWNTASTEQKKALVIAFKDILINTYREAMVGVKNYQFDIKSLKSELLSNGERAQVTANIAYQGKTVRLGNSLAADEQGWKIYDVSVEGISFLSNYRSSFSQIIERDGLDTLINKLKAKTIASGS